MSYIEAVFARHDHNNDLVQDVMEAKAFLADVFELNYRNEFHRRTAHKIMKICETKDGARTIYEC